MTIDLSQVHTYFLALLPVLIGLLAGLIRQDKFKPWINEAILFAFIVIVALIQALLDGKLGASPIADFMLVGGYCTALIKLTPINDLMKSVQSVTSIGGHPVPVAPALPFDLGQLANRLAPFLAQELVKLRMASVVPTVQPQQAAQMPVQQPHVAFTTTVPQPSYTNPNATQVYGMNSGIPGTATTNVVLTDPNQIYNLQTQSVQAVAPQGWTQVPQSGQSG